MNDARWFGGIRTSVAGAVQRITRPCRKTDMETWPLFQAFVQERCRGKREPLPQGGIRQ